MNGILGSLDIAQDPVRDRVTQVAIQIDQVRKGDIVAITGQFDQPRPHVAGLQLRLSGRLIYT